MNVSIVIPNYNGASYILDCIESIYVQMEDKSAIIVVDNHSSDKSIGLIERTYPDITLIKNNSNLGFAAAVNQGIQLAQSKYVILLNNDAFAQPDFVRLLYHRIDRDSKIFSVSSQMLSYAHPELIDNAGDQFSLMGWAFKTGDGEASTCFESERTVFSACAGAAIYRSELFEEIGYFDESFFAYLEDVDLGFRANIFGYKNIYFPAAKVLHIGSASSGSTKYNNFKVKISARNNVYLIFKNMPLFLLILNAPFIVAGCLIKALFFTKKGFGPQYIQGFMEGLKTIHSVKRVKFFRKNVWNYVRVEFMMAKSTVYYFGSYLIKLIRRLNFKETS